MSIYDEIYNEAFNDELDKLASITPAMAAYGALRTGVPSSIIGGGIGAVRAKKGERLKGFGKGALIGGAIGATAGGATGAGIGRYIEKLPSIYQ